MPCSHPNYVLWFDGDFKPDGKPNKVFKGRCDSLPDPVDGVHYALTGCGECTYCRFKKAREWTNRCLLEMDHCNNKALFLTLTYDPEHVPYAPVTFYEDTGEIVIDYDFDADCPLPHFTLSKSDVPDFLKRLRSRLAPLTFRVYGCGEYGVSRSGTHRPHYHAVLFGINSSDIKECKPLFISRTGHQYYTSPWLEDCWSNGLISFCDATAGTIAYTSRYVSKKIYKNSSPEDYSTRIKYNILPEFNFFSTRPGIGCYYPVDHPDCFDHTEVTVFDGVDSHTFPWPKKFRELFGLDARDDFQYYDRVKADSADVLLRAQIAKTDQSFLDYLDTCEQRLLDRAKGCTLRDQLLYETK